MTDNHYPNQACPTCGERIAADLGGHCARCLVNVSLAAKGAEPDHSGSWWMGRDFDGYELLEEVARGGMGVVYRARHPSLDREIAIKMLLAGPFASPGALQRFRAEAQAAASLKHPHIVAIYDVGEWEGQPYFTMDFIAGKSLLDLVRDGPLPPDAAVRYTAQVARAIQHAHERGILHRDLKPSNVLIDLFDEPHITDFGLAKRLANDIHLTISGQLMGSPGYMPPEQASAGRGPVTVASDVYALGALLYHLIAGRVPFASNSPAETVHQVLHDEPASPRALNPALPRDLETICLKCLEKDPARRYPTASAVADELERFLRREPIQARAVSGFERGLRWCNRNRGLALLGTTALAALFLLVMGSLIAAWKIEASRRAEHAARNRATEANTELQSANTALAATVSALELQKAENFIGKGDVSMGLAQLGDILRRNPENSLAAERLLSVLVHRDLALPAAPPLRHPDKVYRVAYSADGRVLLTACADGKVRLWDLATRKEPRVMTHGGEVWFARFTPDEKQVLSASSDGTARVWDVSSGQPVGNPLRHGALLRTVLMSADGKVIATAGDDSVVKIWAVDTGDLLKAWPTGSGRIYALEPGAEPRQVLTASTDATVRGWDLLTGAKTGVEVRHQHWVTALAFSPDRRQLATGSRDKSVRFVDPKSGADLLPPLSQPDGINTIAFSPDGKLLATGCIDYTAHLVDMATRTEVSQALRHGEQVESVAFSPDGLNLASSGQDGLVQFWDTRPGKALMLHLKHTGAVRWLDFSRDSRFLASSAWDNTARIWDLQTGQAFIPPLLHQSHVHSIEFEPAGKRVVTASADGTAMIWDSKSGRQLVPPLRHKIGLWHACFSPNGQRVATASADGTARIWAADTAKPVTDPLLHEGEVLQVRFSPDGTKIATVSTDNSGRIWEANTGQLLARCKHTDAVIWVNFSPDGTRLLTASRDNTARVWAVSSGEALSAPMVHTRTVEMAEFSPDGTMVVTCSQDHTARVWNSGTGEPGSPPMRHSDQLWAAAFSPDGQRVATGGADGVVRVWDATTGLAVSEPLRHTGGVVRLRFSPDGNQLAAATIAPANAVCVWHVTTVRGASPAWLADLAEVVAGVRFGPANTLSNLTSEKVLDVRDHVLAYRGETLVGFAGFARWFFADRATRPLSERSPINVTTYLQARLAENTVESLEEVLRFQPTNTHALSSLAELKWRQPGALSEAIALANRALQIDPDFQVARRLLAAMTGKDPTQAVPK